MTLPLDAITVLELGQVYLGPYCGLLLARLGAEVIKIEPLGGEPVRQRGDGEETKAFSFLNAGKKSVCLDLKTSEGKQLFLDLLVTADVVIENYAVGTMARLGLDYDVLQSVNPRIILGSGTGYGSTGPYRRYKSLDPNVQALTGIMSVTGFADNPPVKTGPAVVDFSAGVHLMAGILAALLQRTTTGRGQHVEVAMQDAILPTLTSNLAGLLDGGPEMPERTGNRHGGLALCPYNVYPTSDGWVSILAINDVQWRALAQATGDPMLSSDASFATNASRVKRMDEVDSRIAAWTETMTADQVNALLQPPGVPCAPVRTLASLFADEHVIERRMLRSIEANGTTHWVFGSPILFDGAICADPAPPPVLGGDTRTILAHRLGISNERCTVLHQSLVVHVDGLPISKSVDSGALDRE